MSDSSKNTSSLGLSPRDKDGEQSDEYSSQRDEEQSDEYSSPRDEDTLFEDTTSTTMLSVDFSTPLSGTARAERIRQLSHNHPALEKTRAIQEVLVKIQHFLRRMPGVTANESGDIAGQLQEVGQVISTETSQLVDALIHLTLDHEDTDRAIARMGLEASLTKATIEDQAQRVRDVEAALGEEKMKREEAEGNLRAVMSESHELRGLVKVLRGEGEDPRDEIIKSLETGVRHLEDQINNRRSLWVMQHSNPQAIARAIETLAESVQGSDAAHQVVLSMRAVCMRYSEPLSPQDDAASSWSRPIGAEMAPPVRPASVFQPLHHRPSSAAPAPPKFGPLQTGPSRAPSAFGQDWRYNNSNSIGHGHTNSMGIGNSNGHSVSNSNGNSISSSWSSLPPRGTPGQNPFYSSAASAFSRAATASAPRRTTAPYHSSRYRTSARDFHPSANVYPDHVPTRPGTSLGHHHPLHAAAHRYQMQSQPPPRGDYMAPPQTPTSNRSRYGRFHDISNNSNPGPRSSEYPFDTPPGRTNTAANDHTVIGPPLRNNTSGPLIQMTDHTVANWNESFMDFYALIRAFVERHANIPDPAMAMKISTTHLWPILLTIYQPLSDREATSYLDLHLRERNPKCCLVTRLIIDYIVSQVWIPAAWATTTTTTTSSSSSSSSSPSPDHHHHHHHNHHALTLPLLDLQRELEQTQGQPSAHRQPLLEKQAHLIETILSSEPPQFHARKINEITSSMLILLQPLLNRLHNPADAHRDLEQVADHAWDLSSRILTSRLTFDFRFPEVGARFSSQSMLPVWPALGASELQAKHWRVALVTTPVVTCRNDRGGNISAHSVALADVYCMQ
ncbi:hypothetical protein E4U60_005573 [Claviceps pazoutovae]|uniref:Uncharacterized protein n=1 Tax=Claviceps pazoutovae TaxID=1649127 RepID=A0A9P7SLU7_9HYPO|nr:hypothetical protein E4U60_005573 [Claviceps pazoutovae]